MTADHCRTSDHCSLRHILTEICGETSDLRFYIAAFFSHLRDKSDRVPRVIYCSVLTYYSDMLSSKPKIMLICGDCGHLRFLGRSLFFSVPVVIVFTVVLSIGYLFYVIGE